MGNGSGVISQAACADLSNAATSCSTDSTNASNITTGTLANARLTGSGTTTVAGQSCALGGTCGLNNFFNQLGADVNLNNAGSYFDGPSTAQGTTGTWFASGGVALIDTASANYTCKLWDGTTIIEAQSISAGPSVQTFVHLSGTFTNPAGNIKISCNDTSTTGKIQHNNAGGTGVGAVLSTIRIN